jgi:ribosomal protein S18 acetylase RimI-like enzyme
VEASIRRAVRDDAASITTVLWTSRRQAMPWLTPHYTEAEARPWVGHVLLATSTVWVAVHGEQIVGYASLGGDMLEQLYILPGQQRQGIGTRLLGTAQEAAGDRIRLYVFARNALARRFYERHDFIPVTESDGTRDEAGEPDVLYEWRRPSALTETS